MVPPIFLFWVETVPTLNPSRIRTLNAHNKEFLPCSHRIKSAMRGHIPHGGILRNAEQCTSPRTKAGQNMQSKFRVANSRRFHHQKQNICLPTNVLFLFIQAAGLAYHRRAKRGVYHQGRRAALVSHHAPACIYLRLDDIQHSVLMIYKATP